MRVTHFQLSGKVNVGICLGDLTTIESHKIHENTSVTIRWRGCSRLVMDVSEAQRLHKLLSDVLE